MSMAPNVELKFRNWSFFDRLWYLSQLQAPTVSFWNEQNFVAIFSLYLVSMLCLHLRHFRFNTCPGTCVQVANFQCCLGSGGGSAVSPASTRPLTLELNAVWRRVQESPRLSLPSCENLGMLPGLRLVSASLVLHARPQWRWVHFKMEQNL